LKNKNGNLTILLALGGWQDSKGDKYSTLVNDPEKRAVFVQSAIGFLRDNNFDGLDLDWEYPTCWQVDCNAGPTSDKDGFTALIKELREAMDEEDKNLLLTAAVSPSSDVIQKAYNIPELSKYLNYISVMTYDYHGQWDKQTGHVAPIYEHPDDLDSTFNIVSIPFDSN
jgi:chitinase